MQPTTPAPLLFSEPMPNESKHENGEGREDDEKKDKVENPWYDPGFENLTEEENKTGDELVDQTVHQDDVVTKNFFEQSSQNVSIADQEHTVKANYGGEHAIIAAGRDEDPSVADAMRSVSSEEGDPVAKTQAFDSLATRKAMYTGVLGDQVERGRITSEEEAAKASSELGSIIEAGTSALNTAGSSETTEATLAKEHLKHTLDEAAEIKAKTDAKLSAEPTPDGSETEYEAADTTGEDAEAEESSESGELGEETTVDSPEESADRPTTEASTAPEQEPAETETEPIPVFLHYDDQADYDQQQAIYDAMAAQHPKKKPEGDPEAQE